MLGLANKAFSDEHDYSVTINGQLFKGGKEIAKYSATGSHHSEMPTSEAIPVKVEHVQKNVLLSWDHALKVLAEQIKQDRAKIVQ